jgi:hypothetical protein
MTIHQHMVLLSHIAIEKLEQQAFATVRILRKLLERTVEVAIGADVQRDAKFIRNSLKLRSYTPVAGLNHDQSFGFQPFDIKPQDLTKRLPAILRPLPVKLVVFDRAFCHRQFVSEMAHRRQKQRDSQFVAPDVSRLFFHLCHPDDIGFRIETVESSRSMIKLIA